MPIYEFYSPDTNKVYSFFARSISQGAGTPRCPDKPGARMERMLSRFAVTGRSREKTGSQPADGDRGMDRVMAEMEREMAGIDETNPDPKALGRMMRRMAEATGQQVPREMEQMIRRLEAGEDPEKLEEEFGDALADIEEPGDEAAGEGPGSAQGLRHRLRRPVRDPALYEMSDYL